MRAYRASCDTQDPRLDQVRIVHRIREGSQKVEDGPHRDFFAGRSGEAHTGVPFASVEESVVGPRVDVWEVLGGRGCYLRSGRFGVLEEIGGAGEGGGAVVAVFGDEEEGGGEDRGRGGDVVGVVAVAAGAYYVALLRGKSAGRGLGCFGVAAVGLWAYHTSPPR